MQISGCLYEDVLVAPPLVFGVVELPGITQLGPLEGPYATDV